MSEPTRPYLAYLLRCWQEDGTTNWRATLENPHSGEIIGFASLRQLYQFLDQQTQTNGMPTPAEKRA